MIYLVCINIIFLRRLNVIEIKALMDEGAQILHQWKGDQYVFGFNVLGEIGRLTKPLGSRALLVVADLDQKWMAPFRKRVEESLKEVEIHFETIAGAHPNTPMTDVYRLALQLSRSNANVVLALGGGSTIDAVKASTILATFSPSEVQQALGINEVLASTIEPYFGTDCVSKVVRATGQSPKPVVAIMTAASSGAHLTLASNITDPNTHQKGLILDPILYPAAALFDYAITLHAPKDLTVDGGLDGIAHAWEVLTGATHLDNYPDLRRVTEIAMRLIIVGLQKFIENPQDQDARIALGLGTDVGGYCLMKGAGTHGPHLGSFSLVDILTHGRSCAVLNPYYTVLFFRAIQDQLKMAAQVFHDAGHMNIDETKLTGYELGLAVAQSMITLWKELGFPTTLKDCGATPAHLDRMIRAAKNPQLKMKLNQMPEPMDVERGDVDRLMRPTLEAAFSGDFNLIPKMK
jgi:alcohol dehydrogenase class IV